MSGVQRKSRWGWMASLAAVLSVASIACSGPNTDPYDPGPLSIQTVPSEAKVELENGRVYWSPARLPSDVDVETEVVISKDGFVTWRGAIEDLPKVGEASFRVTLVRAESPAP